MADQASITIEGTPYLIPTLDSISVDESKILKRQSGMTLDQFFELEGLDGGAIGGLLAVAMKRSDPSLKDADIDAIVGQVNMFDVMEQFAAFVDSAPDPTRGGQPPADDGSKTSSDESTRSSGRSGDDVSGLFPVKSSPASTGLPTSETTVDSSQVTSVP